MDIMSALSVIWKRNLSHFRPLHTLVLPILLYKYKDQSLVKGMFMIFFISCILNNSSPF